MQSAIEGAAEEAARAPAQDLLNYLRTVNRTTGRKRVRRQNINKPGMLKRISNFPFPYVGHDLNVLVVIWLTWKDKARYVLT